MLNTFILHVYLPPRLFYNPDKAVFFYRIKASRLNMSWVQANTRRLTLEECRT
jgi:hypothetical protein